MPLNPFTDLIHKQCQLEVEMIIPDNLSFHELMKQQMQRPEYKITSLCQECHEPIEVIVYAADWIAWKDGEYMQDVWPDETPEEREEICLCIHVGCSDKFYGMEDEDE